MRYMNNNRIIIQFIKHKIANIAHLSTNGIFSAVNLLFSSPLPGSEFIKNRD